MAESAMPYSWVHNKPRATRHQLRWGIEPHLAKINTHTPKIEHTPSRTTETQNKHTPPTQRPPHSTPVKETQRRGSHHRIQHRPPRLGPCNTKTSVQYTNEGDPAQEGTEQEQNDAQIRAMQHKNLRAVHQSRRPSTGGHDTEQNKMPRLGPCKQTRER